ncbi:MAG TPA: hypothetical protein ENK18_01435 [Deltaproteobacteria bacterium]|nr:hypothetical protein [Deltaproteobacteria bacterium]
MLLLAALLSSARAQVQACPGPFTLEEWSEAMDEVDVELIALNGTRAAHLLEDILGELRCLDEIVSPEVLGRLARQVALVTFYDQDPEELVPWALLARRTLGAAPWPDALPAPAYFHELMASEPQPQPEGPGDRGLAPPRGGGMLIDGFLALQPQAAARARHLVQVADRRGRVLETWWQRGGRFPETWLGEPGVSLDVPRWYEAPPEPLEPPIPVPAPSFARAPAPPPGQAQWGLGAEPAAAVEPRVPTVPGPQPGSSGGVDPGGVDPGGADPGGADPGGADPGGADPGGADPGEVGATAGHEPARGAAQGRSLRFTDDRRNEACPWSVDPRYVEIRGPRIQVNRRVFWIRSEEDEQRFVVTLRDCGEHRAARWFLRWRAARGQPFTGAARHRDAMVDALLQKPRIAHEPAPGP